MKNSKQIRDLIKLVLEYTQFAQEIESETKLDAIKKNELYLKALTNAETNLNKLQQFPTDEVFEVYRTHLFSLEEFKIPGSSTPLSIPTLARRFNAYQLFNEFFEKTEKQATENNANENNNSQSKLENNASNNLAIAEDKNFALLIKTLLSDDYDLKFKKDRLNDYFLKINPNILIYQDKESNTALDHVVLHYLAQASSLLQGKADNIAKFEAGFNILFELTGYKAATRYIPDTANFATSENARLFHRSHSLLSHLATIQETILKIEKISPILVKNIKAQWKNISDEMNLTLFQPTKIFNVNAAEFETLRLKVTNLAEQINAVEKNVPQAQEQTEKLQTLLTADFSALEIRSLIRQNATPNLLARNGKSILDILTTYMGTYSSSYITEMVCKYAADPNFKNSDGSIPLQNVLNNKNCSSKEILIWLLLGADPNVQDDQGNGVLNKLLTLDTEDYHTLMAIRLLVKSFGVNTAQVSDQKKLNELLTTAASLASPETMIKTQEQKCRDYQTNIEPLLTQLSELEKAKAPLGTSKIQKEIFEHLQLLKRSYVEFPSESNQNPLVQMAIFLAYLHVCKYYLTTNEKNWKTLISETQAVYSELLPSSTEPNNGNELPVFSKIRAHVSKLGTVLPNFEACKSIGERMNKQIELFETLKTMHAEFETLKAEVEQEKTNKETKLAALREKIAWLDIYNDNKKYEKLSKKEKIEQLESQINTELLGIHGEHLSYIKAAGVDLSLDEFSQLKILPSKYQEYISSEKVTLTDTAYAAQSIRFYENVNDALLLTPAFNNLFRTLKEQHQQIAKKSYSKLSPLKIPTPFAHLTSKWRKHYSSFNETLEEHRNKLKPIKVQQERAEEIKTILDDVVKLYDSYQTNSKQLISKFDAEVDFYQKKFTSYLEEKTEPTKTIISTLVNSIDVDIKNKTKSRNTHLADDDFTTQYHYNLQSIKTKITSIKLEEILKEFLTQELPLLKKSFDDQEKRSNDINAKDCASNAKQASKELNEKITELDAKKAQEELLPYIETLISKHEELLKLKKQISELQDKASTQKQLELQYEKVRTQFNTLRDDLNANLITHKSNKICTRDISNWQNELDGINLATTKIITQSDIDTVNKQIESLQTFEKKISAATEIDKQIKAENEKRQEIHKSISQLLESAKNSELGIEQSKVRTWTLEHTGAQRANFTNINATSANLKALQKDIEEAEKLKNTIENTVKSAQGAVEFYANFEKESVAEVAKENPQPKITVVSAKPASSLFDDLSEVVQEPTFTTSTTKPAVSAQPEIFVAQSPKTSVAQKIKTETTSTKPDIFADLFQTSTSVATSRKSTVVASDWLNEALTQKNEVPKEIPPKQDVQSSFVSVTSNPADEFSSWFTITPKENTKTGSTAKTSNVSALNAAESNVAQHETSKPESSPVLTLDEPTKSVTILSPQLQNETPQQKTELAAPKDVGEKLKQEPMPVSNNKDTSVQPKLVNVQQGTTKPKTSTAVRKSQTISTLAMPNTAPLSETTATTNQADTAASKTTDTSKSATVITPPQNKESQKITPVTTSTHVTPESTLETKQPKSTKAASAKRKSKRLSVAPIQENSSVPQKTEQSIPVDANQNIETSKAKGSEDSSASTKHQSLIKVIKQQDQSKAATMPKQDLVIAQLKQKLDLPGADNPALEKQLTQDQTTLNVTTNDIGTSQTQIQKPESDTSKDSKKQKRKSRKLSTAPTTQPQENKPNADDTAASKTTTVTVVAQKPVDIFRKLNTAIIEFPQDDKTEFPRHLIPKNKIKGNVSQSYTAASLQLDTKSDNQPIVPILDLEQINKIIKNFDPMDAYSLKLACYTNTVVTLLRTLREHTLSYGKALSEKQRNTLSDLTRSLNTLLKVEYGIPITDEYQLAFNLLDKNLAGNLLGFELSNNTYAFHFSKAVDPKLLGESIVKQINNAFKDAFDYLPVDPKPAGFWARIFFRVKFAFFGTKGTSYDHHPQSLYCKLITEIDECFWNLKFGGSLTNIAPQSAMTENPTQYRRTLQQAPASSNQSAAGVLKNASETFPITQLKA